MGQFLFFMTTFIAGLIIGIVKCWQLALVILAIVPVLAACGAAYQTALTGVTAREKQAYAAAGSIAEQVSKAAHTLCSFIMPVLQCGPRESGFEIALTKLTTRRDEQACIEAGRISEQASQEEHTQHSACSALAPVCTAG